jgi:hypothetical protein
MILNSMLKRLRYLTQSLLTEIILQEAEQINFKICFSSFCKLSVSNILYAYSIYILHRYYFKRNIEKYYIIP